MELAELISVKRQNIEDNNIKVDINIKFGKVPKEIEDSKIKSLWYEASSKEYLLKVEGIAKYYVKDGKSIIIDPSENSLEEDVRVFLLNSILAVALQQRGFFILHASAAVIHGKAVVFSGASNSGKTAIALSLYDKGYDLICDEICAIKIENGKAMVVAGIPQLNIWHNTLIKTKKDIKSYKPIRRGINKYEFNIKDRYYENPMEISNIFILNKHNNEEIIIEEIKGVEKFDSLTKNAYKFYLEELIFGKQEIFKNYIIISQKSNVFKAVFNDYLDDINTLRDLILKELKTHE